MALKYAWGTATMAEAVPTSAFSKGDLLVYTSNSSLSRAPDYTSLDIAGIAMAASNESVNNKVPYLIPDADTVFWSDCTAASQLTPGTEREIIHVTGVGPKVVTSAITAPFVVVQRGTQNIKGQSVQSRVLVKLVRHDGKLEHS